MNPATITIATLSIALAGAVLACGLMLHQNGKQRREKNDDIADRNRHMTDLSTVRVELKKMTRKADELEGERDALATVPAGNRWQYEWNVN